MADDDIREGSPKKAKKAPPPDEEEEDRPRKKKREADEEEEEAPRKKKKRMDEDEQEESDLGASPLSAIIPVGGSIFALMSFLIGLISFVLALVALASRMDVVHPVGWVIPPIIACLLPSLWPLALISGGLAFLTHKSKASYGSIAGNLRAIIGILLSLATMVVHGVLVFMWIKG